MEPWPTSATWYSVLGGQGFTPVWVRSSEGLGRILQRGQWGGKLATAPREWPSGGAKLGWLLNTSADRHCLEVCGTRMAASATNNSEWNGVLVFVAASVALGHGGLDCISPCLANARRSGVKTARYGRPTI